MRFQGVLAALLAFTIAGAAWGANLGEVRTGVHADYTRVVFQLDGAAPYEMTSLRAKDGGNYVLVLRMDAAATRPGNYPVAKSPHLEAVKVAEAGPDASTVRIRMRGDLELKELVLKGPDRIVLDFFAPGSGKAPLASTLAPPVQPGGSEAPAPAPKPETLAEAMPADDFEEAPAAEDEAEELTAEVVGAADEPDETMAEEDEGAFSGVEIAEVVPAQPEPQAQPAVPPTPESADSGGLFGNPIVLAGVGLVAIVGVLFVLGRRRRGGDEEESLSPLDMDTDGAPATPEAMEAPAGGLFDDDTAEAADAPEATVVDDDEPGEPAPYVDPVDGPSDHDIEPEAAFAPPKAAEGSFDVPADQAATMIAPAPAVGSPTELGSGEVAKMVEEFERRIASLESRLEEVSDGRERIERQVTAQTEELRVQRAAIARTQRVLRTIARPEDDIPEPAPKV